MCSADRCLAPRTVRVHLHLGKSRRFFARATVLPATSHHRLLRGTEAWIHAPVLTAVELSLERHLEACVARSEAFSSHALTATHAGNLSAEMLARATRELRHVLRERLRRQLQPLHHREVREELVREIVNGEPSADRHGGRLNDLAGLGRDHLSAQ